MAMRIVEFGYRCDDWLGDLAKRLRPICRAKRPPICHRHRLQLLGPDATSAATSAEHLATPVRLSLLEKSLQTVLALPVAVRLAAIINSPADG